MERVRRSSGRVRQLRRPLPLFTAAPGPTVGDGETAPNATTAADEGSGTAAAAPVIVQWPEPEENDPVSLTKLVQFSAFGVS